jgi:hypothetical protein
VKRLDQQDVLKCALKARADNLGAPPVRWRLDNDDPEVSPLATFEARLQRLVVIDQSPGQASALPI